ncbi:MAG: hypothetical protein HYZ34_07085 [Ignavibacteriae bacterium]|nr:hypothetical protein [Ignavibacteriota bacterium]
MKTIIICYLIILCSFNLFAQSSADSVTITFRAYEASNAMMFVPGEFNDWGPNNSGVIASNAISRMNDYNSSMGAWSKTYTFKISATGRSLADTIYQYKLNKGGCSSCWYPDPLNREQNSSDNSNSILRMSKLFWFQYNQVVTGNNISRITIGLIRANSDLITSVSLSYGATKNSTLTTIDVTSGYNTTTRILDTILTTPIPKSNFIKLVAVNNHGDTAVYSKGGYIWY